MADYTLTGGPNVAGPDGVVRAATQDQLNAGNVTMISNAASEAANAVIAANAAAALASQAEALVTPLVTAGLAAALADALVELGFTKSS